MLLSNKEYKLIGQKGRKPMSKTPSQGFMCGTLLRMATIILRFMFCSQRATRKLKNGMSRMNQRIPLFCFPVRSWLVKIVLLNLQELSHNLQSQTPISRIYMVKYRLKYLGGMMGEIN